VETLGEDDRHCPGDEGLDSANLKHCGVGCYRISANEMRYWCTGITGGCLG